MILPKTIAAQTALGGSVDFSNPDGLEYSNVLVSGAAEVSERKYIDTNATPYVVPKGASAERIDISGVVDMSNARQKADIFTLYALNGKEVKVSFADGYPFPYNNDRIYILIFADCGGKSIACLLYTSPSPRD